MLLRPDSLAAGFSEDQQCLLHFTYLEQSFRAVSRTYISELFLTTHTNESWGFLHPECHGRNALVFFSWDLAKVIEQQFTLHAQATIAVRLYEAQKAVDRLLKQYVQIQANPDAFEGQSIELTLTQDDANSDEAVLVLKTSPHLEALILEAQEQEQASRTLN